MSVVVESLMMDEEVEHTHTHKSRAGFCGWLSEWFCGCCGQRLIVRQHDTGANVPRRNNSAPTVGYVVIPRSCIERAPNGGTVNSTTFTKTM